MSSAELKGLNRWLPPVEIPSSNQRRLANKPRASDQTGSFPLEMWSSGVSWPRWSQVLAEVHCPIEINTGMTIRLRRHNFTGGYSTKLCFINVCPFPSLELCIPQAAVNVDEEITNQNVSLTLSQPLSGSLAFWGFFTDRNDDKFPDPVYILQLVVKSRTFHLPEV